MKKKLGDFTLAEIKAICSKHRSCQNCPFKTEWGYNQCLFIDETVDCSLSMMELNMEVEIKEKEK